LVAIYPDELQLLTTLEPQLFDDKAAKGKVSSDASKESVVQQAGEVALKMYLKNQGEQQGGLLGMASKFMNK
jgi:hypothetical protein